MPNYALLGTGQQAVTTGPAQALPSVVPPNPLGAVLTGSTIPRGEGVRVNLACVGSAALFYGNNNGVTPANGKAIAAGQFRFVRRQRSRTSLRGGRREWHLHGELVGHE
jgi:hypothetical protein